MSNRGRIQLNNRGVGKRKQSLPALCGEPILADRHAKKMGGHRCRQLIRRPTATLGKGAIGSAHPVSGMGASIGKVLKTLFSGGSAIGELGGPGWRKPGG